MSCEFVEPLNFLVIVLSIVLLGQVKHSLLIYLIILDLGLVYLTLTHVVEKKSMGDESNL